MTTTALSPVSLETDRLRLCPPTAADLPAYQAFYDATDVRVGKYRGGRDAAQIAAILNGDMDHWQAKGFGMFMLRPRGSDTPVGGAGLAHPDDWPHHELTWWLMPAARGQGFATEASRAIVAWAYDDLGWPTVETHMRDENTAARRVAERLDGRLDRRETFPDGVARDIYALPRGARQ